MSDPISKRSVQSKIVYMNSIMQLPLTSTPGFEEEIKWQERLYPLPLADSGAQDCMTQNYVMQRLEQFKKILLDEVSEVDDIILGIASGQRHKDLEPQFEFLGDGQGNKESEAIAYDKLDALTDIADWLADITVYCRSEAERYGLPYEEIMHIVMDSNFSKLDAQGKPIMKDGKFQKGPFYWAPEDKIGALIRDLIAGS